MGIDFPVIVETSTVSDVVVPKSAAPVETAIAAGPEAPAAESRGVPLKRYDFVLQFVWQPSPPPAPAAAGTATP
jgi:hypothetical protein